MTAANHATAENLLFGVLALQNDFVTRNQLVAATGAWIGDKSRSLESILVEEGALDEEERRLLAALVRKHLANHGNDPEQSLRALSSLQSSVKNELTHLNDSLVTQSVAQVSLDRDREESRDIYATQSIPLRNAAPADLRFRVLRPHARGGLGKVSVALDGELNREVAFKELLDEHADSLAKRSRFLVEAEITGALEHPGIVPVYGLGHYADGRPFYAMRFIQGDSLKEAIEAFHRPGAQKMSPGERALQLRKLLARFIDVCEAIEYAHSRGVLHRDLKPGNIMLGKYGETLVVDWGLAKAGHRERSASDLEERPLNVGSKADSSETQMGTRIGTPAFMPPEQAEGRLDLLGPASDVYSLGATLYCLLTGRAPFSEETLEETLAKVSKGRFPPPREVDRHVPRALDAICRKAMARAPNDRYASAEALAEDVEHWLADEPVSAYSESAVQRAGRWMRRHRSWTLAGAAALAVVAVTASIAAVTINAARKREANLHALAEASRRFDLLLVAQQQTPDVISEATLRDLDAQWRQIAGLPVVDAAASGQLRRKQLFDAYLADLRRSLTKSPFSDDDRRDFDGRVKLLTDVFGADDAVKTAVTELQAGRDARLAEWDPLLQWHGPFDDAKFAKSLPPEVAIAKGIDRLGRTADAGPLDWISTGVACPPGNIELSAVFDLSWRQAPVLGLSLNYSQEHRYDFLVAVPDFQFGADDDIGRLPTLGEAAGKLDDRQLFMLIARDGEVLRRASLPPSDAPLRLRARREGNRLSLRVNDAFGIELTDPFAFPAGSAGEFAVIWPRAAYLERLTALRQRAPSQATPMEHGDELFAQGFISDALQIYQAIAGSPEAQYKAGLCQEQLGDSDAYLRAMQQVADESPQEAVQWRLLANVRLMKAHADAQNVELLRARLAQVASRFQVEEIAQLLPAADRQALFEDVRRVGQRYRIAVAPIGDIEDLQLAASLDDAFNEDLHQRRTTRWRLADAYRVHGAMHKDRDSYASAETILHGLIADQPGELAVAPRERAALVSDLAWTLMEQEKYDEARREVEPWLAEERGEIPADYLSLLIDRGRLSYLQNNPEPALQDATTYLQRADLKKISHAEYAAALMLRSLVLEDRGELDQAREDWLKASYRAWHAGKPEAAAYATAQGVEMIHLTDSYNLDTIATSWTGELTNEEAYERMVEMASGAAMGSKVVERVLAAAVTKDLIREVSVGMYQDEAGRQLGRDTILRRISLRDVHTRGAVQMLYLGVMRSTFRDDHPTREEDRFIFSQCQEIFDVFDRGLINNDDMITIIEFWQGKGSMRDWEKLSVKFENPPLAASVAYLIGRMHLLRGKPQSAKQFYDYVLKSPDAHSYALDWTRRDLEKLNAPKAPAG